MKFPVSFVLLFGLFRQPHSAGYHVLPIPLAQCYLLWWHSTRLQHINRNELYLCGWHGQRTKAMLVSLTSSRKMQPSQEKSIAHCVASGPGHTARRSSNFVLCTGLDPDTSRKDAHALKLEKMSTATATTFRCFPSSACLAPGTPEGFPNPS